LRYITAREEPGAEKGTADEHREKGAGHILALIRGVSQKTKRKTKCPENITGLYTGPERTRDTNCVTARRKPGEWLPMQYIAAL
jgi:hypothetical protein